MRLIKTRQIAAQCVHWAGAVRRQIFSSLLTALRVRKRGKKIMAALVLMVVGVTFALKEIKRDQTKDSIEAIDRGQNAFEVRKELGKVLVGIQRVHDNVVDITDYENKYKFPNFDDHGIDTVLRKASDVEVDDDWTLTNLVNLFDELKDDSHPEVKDRLNMLKEQFKTVSVKRETLQRKALQEFTIAIARPAKSAPAAYSEDVFNEAGELLGREIELDQQIQKTVPIVLSNAACVRKKAESSYRRYSILFYVSFGVGLLLNLIDKMWFTHEQEGEAGE